MELLAPSPLRADVLPNLKTLVIPGPSSKHEDAIGKMIAISGSILLSARCSQSTLDRVSRRR
jgi:hypothetical protein